MVSFEDYTKPEMINGVQYYKTEIIDGKKYDRLGDDLRHQQILGNLICLLGGFMKKQKGEVLPGLGIKFDENNFLIPDISVFSPTSRLVTDDVECSPDLVVEIATPFTRGRDMMDKLAAYSKFGIMEYWVVQPESQAVDIYMLNPLSLKLEISTCCVVIAEDDVEYQHLPESEKANVHTTIYTGMFGKANIAVKDIFEGI